MRRYAKELAANDVGKTGGHQGGILVPKKMDGLLEFLPKLDPSKYNPRATIYCLDSTGVEWEMQYIHYNNKVVKHPDTGKYGTRNEYRITHMTKFLKLHKAQEGDLVEFEEVIPRKKYKISFVSSKSVTVPARQTTMVFSVDKDEDDEIPVITLKGWRKY